MAQVSVSTLKSYFKSGARPDNPQFIDLIDTLSVVGSVNAFIEYSLSLTLSGSEYIQDIPHELGQKNILVFAVISDSLVFPEVRNMTTSSLQISFDSNYSGEKVYLISTSNLVAPSSGITLLSIDYTTPNTPQTIEHNLANPNYFVFAKDTTANSLIEPTAITNVTANSCDVEFTSAFTGNIYFIGAVNTGTEKGTILERASLDTYSSGSSATLYSPGKAVVTDFTLRVSDQIGSSITRTAQFSIGSDAPDFSNIIPKTNFNLLEIGEIFQPGRFAGKIPTHYSSIKAKVDVAASGGTSQNLELVLFGYEV